MASYHLNSGLTWGQYLQANAFVKDITGTIRKNGQETRHNVSEQTRTIVASNEALSRAFQQGFDHVNNTLAEGFGMVGRQLDAVNQGIEELGAIFEYGLGLLIEQVVIQNQLLSDVLEKLDAMHQTLQTPTLTQAREFYNIGRQRLNKGFLDKALEAFLQAEAKNDTDFLIQSALGHLYLYGLNEDCNVVDIVKAEQHFRNAARYAKPEISQLPEARKYCGEAYLHASIACYAQAHEEQHGVKQLSVDTLLQNAAKLAQQATEIYSPLGEGFYQYAKMQALLGDTPQALTSLTQAIKRDRNYCLKTDADRDFDAIRPQIFEVFEQLRQQAQDEARTALYDVQHLLDEYVFQSSEARQIQQDMTELIHQAEGLFPNGTYFDYLDIIAYPVQAQTRLDNLNVPTELTETLPGDGYEFSSLAFSPDSRYLAASGSCHRASTGLDATVRLWEMPSGKMIMELRHKEQVPSVAFSPDGRYLASGSGDNMVRLWEMPSGKLLSTLRGHVESIISVAFSPDGRYLASGSMDKTVGVWEVPSGKLMTTLSEHTAPVYAVAFSPDGRYLASSMDKAVGLWEMPSGKLIATLLSGGTRWVISIAFSPDGRYIALGSVYDEMVRLLEIPSGKILATLAGHAESIRSVAFSSNGRYLASGNEKNVRLWEMPSGREIATLIGKLSYSAAFSPDGWYLASGGTTIELWGQRHFMSKRVLKLQEQALNQEKERQKREKEEASRREEQLRADRRRQGLCEICGTSLGLLGKLGGHVRCKKCR